MGEIMTISEFKSEVCALLNRSPESLIKYDQDLVINAANRGKRYAQRMVDFQFLRTTVNVTASLSQGIGLDSAIDVVTGARVEINKVVRGVLPFADGSNYSLEFGSLNTHRTREQAYAEGNRYESGNRSVSVGWRNRESSPFLYRHGRKIFLKACDNALFGGQTEIPIQLDVVAFDKDFQTNNNVYVSYANEGSPGSYQPEVFFPQPVTFVQEGFLHDLPFFTSKDATSAFGVYDPAAILYYNYVQGYWMVTKNLFAAPPDINTTFNYWRSSVAGVDGLYGTYIAVNFTPDTTIYPDSVMTVSSGSSTITADVNDSGIFLGEGQEWLLLYTLQFLQAQFIKSEERWPVTKAQVEAAWRSLVAWNESISDGEVQSNLE